MDEVLTIKSVYFDLGRSLRLRSHDLKAICTKYSKESDAKRALNDVLVLWLTQQYNVENFGPPTWRMLVEAVDKKSGGNNRELAKEIALNHPAVAGMCRDYVCIESLVLLYIVGAHEPLDG